MKMQYTNVLLLIKLFTLHYLLVLGASLDYDFYYLLLQWPESYCNTKQGCCYPTTGKPRSDFVIHGLIPYKNNVSSTIMVDDPIFCDPSNRSPFVESKISDLTSQIQSTWPSLWCPSNNGSMFWAHVWKKHGTCSESVLSQHDYYATTLNLANKINLLKALQIAGIRPNDQKYSSSSVINAIKGASGYTPRILCNTDPSGSKQINYVFFCVDITASGFIECPIFPNGGCGSSMKFPSF